MRSRGQEIAHDAIHEGMTEYEIAEAIDKAIAESTTPEQPVDWWKPLWRLARAVANAPHGTSFKLSAEEAIKETEALCAAAPKRESVKDTRKPKCDCAAKWDGKSIYRACRFCVDGQQYEDETACKHYNMTVNGKCNDCGHTLTAEEQQFYER